jgi:tripartite ATP-independent transporter DctP family solute receptor
MLTRRSFVLGATAGSATLLIRRVRAADFTFTQYHNQTAASSLHRRLVQMWDTVRTETGGRVQTRVFPENNHVEGSDPAALKLVLAGEIQFFTLMGGIIGTVVPIAEIQQVPFVFRSAAHAQQTMDGPLGAYIRQELATKGLHGFAVGAFDNGMRQVAGPKRPIVVPTDFTGIRMRVPAGEMVADTFRSLGAAPVTVNSNAIYEAVKSGRVDAQENPLALLDLFKLYEVVKYVSLTNHMWSGFNMLAHQPTWNRLPADIQAVIDRNVATHVRLQRQDQEQANTRLRKELEGRGLVFNAVDQAPFRAALGGFYAKWKTRLGTKGWSLLEAAT